MQHIEAVAGEYFGAKELGKADVEYNKMLVEFIPELGARFKQSKLALFDELINFKGDFDQRVKGVQKKNILQRLFGESIAFIGQEGGDHWLYNRTAIAMAMRQKVIVPGKGEISLWEAFQIVEDANGLKKMVVPKGTIDTSGKEFNVYKNSDASLVLTSTYDNKEIEFNVDSTISIELSSGVKYITKNT